MSESASNQESVDGTIDLQPSYANTMMDASNTQLTPAQQLNSDNLQGITEQSSLTANEQLKGSLKQNDETYNYSADRDNKVMHLFQPINDNKSRTRKTLIAKHVFSHKKERNNYTRGCQFSPDGLCVLVCNDDNKLRIFDPPSQQTVKSQDETNQNNEDHHMNNDNAWNPAVVMSEPGPVYDFAWYPLMNSADSATCCIAATAQSQPVHLYDAFDGHIRATYRCYDQADEVIAGRSLAFDPSGQKLYVGLKNEICIFNVAVPGRDCEKRKTTDKKGDVGVSGIISTIAVNPAMPSVYAVGTYTRGLAVYLEPDPRTLCFLDGQKGGITYIKFSSDGTKLLAGSRKDNEILVWDMRNPGTLYATLQRDVSTNQRIYFDIDPTCQHVASGNTNGTLKIWDIKNWGASQKISQDNGMGDVLPYLLSEDSLHDDCINGVSFHPHEVGYVATSSGQRRYGLELSTWNDSSDEENEENRQSSHAENSLKIWNFSVNENVSIN